MYQVEQVKSWAGKFKFDGPEALSWLVQKLKFVGEVQRIEGTGTERQEEYDLDPSKTKWIPLPTYLHGDTVDVKVYNRVQS